MIGRNGEEFSSFVKLDMNTGRTMYSRTPNGFNEQQAPRIPAEVYGHVFTAQEKANLQDGKTLLVEGLKNNGQTFSSYLKVNPYSGQLQYFQEIRTSAGTLPAVPHRRRPHRDNSRSRRRVHRRQYRPARRETESIIQT